ncbi:MAG: PadR family transcriptional regulator [Verrucomicrobiota bacterium]
MAAEKTELVKGTLEMLILRVLAREEMHGWGIAERIKAWSRDVLKVEEGSLYPALYRLEMQGLVKGEWRVSENNRRAKFYTLTKGGVKELEREKQNWDRVVLAIANVMQSG